MGIRELTAQAQDKIRKTKSQLTELEKLVKDDLSGQVEKIVRGILERAEQIRLSSQEAMKRLQKKAKATQKSVRSAAKSVSKNVAKSAPRKPKKKKNVRARR